MPPRCTKGGTNATRPPQVEKRNFEAAATCFRKAGKPSQAQAFQAQAQLHAATQVDDGGSVGAQEQRSLRFDAGYQLLATAVNAPAEEASAEERRQWLQLAAQALASAGEQAAAARISGLLK